MLSGMASVSFGSQESGMASDQSVDSQESGIANSDQETDY